jgi:hypothetical protein
MKTKNVRWRNEGNYRANHHMDISYVDFLKINIDGYDLREMLKLL